NEAPKVFGAARQNLDASLPQPFVETAIEVANGSADFLEKDLVAGLKDLHDDAIRGQFTSANQRAIAELRSYVGWLKSEKLPKADKSNKAFALGRSKFARILREGELIDWSPDRILEMGLRQLKREQEI